MTQKSYETSIEKVVKITRRLFGEESIKVLVEIGARDCRETLGFHKLLPNANIYTFECNPQTLPECRTTVKNISKIFLIEKAVSDVTGKIKFYPINPSKTITTWVDGNPGASSIFKASGNYPIEKYVQDEIEVESLRLEDFIREKSINKIDLMWMDIQGAELLALKGLGGKIKEVKLLHLEVEFFEIYSNQPLYKDLKAFLNKNGFLLIGFTHFDKYSGDAVFLNRNTIKNKIILSKYLFSDKILFFKYILSKKSTHLLQWISSTLKSITTKIHIILKLMTFDCRTYYLSVSKFFQQLFDFKRFCFSDVPIDVLITATEKDIDTLPYTIQSVKLNVRHPIIDIFVIASDSDEIKSICHKEKCNFLDENTILPITKEDIDYFVKGVDRSGWLFQQLLKLSGDKICTQEYFLIIDADTVLIKAITFLFKNKILFLYSDEYHLPYFKTYQKLLGTKAKSCVSFISHHMFFHNSKLNALKKKIEDKNNCLWYEAIINNIDKTEMSSFSEYETYGNFVLMNYPKNVKMKYFFNLSLNKNKIKELSQFTEDLNNTYYSISFHSYNQ